MKILNLYAGIGGNRKLWGDEHQVTAVEYKPEIAKVYQDHFPNDTVIVADAHQYLLDHFMEYDFIWSSPPCPSHSDVRQKTTSVFKEGGHKPLYPDMKLYQEIIFLEHHFKGKWCVENVIAYYKPLIRPFEMDNHWWWSNFLIRDFTSKQSRAHDGTIEELQKRKGFDLTPYKNIDKRLALRNCVEPEIAKHILECSQKELEISLFA